MPPTCHPEGAVRWLLWRSPGVAAGCPLFGHPHSECPKADCRKAATRLFTCRTPQSHAIPAKVHPETVLAFSGGSGRRRHGPLHPPSERGLECFACPPPPPAPCKQPILWMGRIAYSALQRALGAGCTDTRQERA